ncbi:hypothetical protein BD413DRAFT_19797 [Trametes elegans]|nr:hypothetical protein BD413DRAFT_19797 [Trametes elegans]
MSPLCRNCRSSAGHSSGWANTALSRPGKVNHAQTPAHRRAEPDRTATGFGMYTHAARLSLPWA